MGMFLFFHAFWGVLPAATPERLGVWTYNQDLLWSVGNAASGAFGAPFGDMRMAGYALNYHYLNDLSAGLLARAAGASAWAGLAFYWYAPVGLLTLAALRCAGLRMSQPTEESILAGDWQAARWLEENSDPADIFATNRNNKTFAGSDGVFHFYTAASEWRSYLESYRYALDYDNAYAETRRRLEQVSDAIFYRLGEEEAFRLAREEGVDWLLVSTQVEGWPQWQRTPDFANDAVRLYRVPA